MQGSSARQQPEALMQPRQAELSESGAPQSRRNWRPSCSGYMQQQDESMHSPKSSTAEAVLPKQPPCRRSQLGKGYRSRVKEKPFVHCPSESLSTSSSGEYMKL